MPISKLCPWRHPVLLVAILAFVPVPAPAQERGAPVTVAEARTEPIVNAVRLSGTVVAPRSARISAAVGGLVEDVAVELGDRVAAGDTLVRLDPAVVRHEVDRAEAAMEVANAELAEARRRLRVAQRLVERGNMPQNELDAREAQVRIAANAVERMEAEAARERERLKRHTITAPFAGVVAHKATEAGEWVAPGTAVVELVDVDHLLVDVPVPQRYFPELRDAPAVSLEFDAIPDREFGARVAARVPVSDPTARTFTLRLRPTANNIRLTPGMSARVTLRLATGERGIVIPRDAVIRYPDGRTTVWVTESEGERITVAERRVELGRAFDGRVHVRQGLSEGARVVVRGNEGLRAGQRVRLAEGAG